MQLKLKTITVYTLILTMPLSLSHPTRNINSTTDLKVRDKDPLTNPADAPSIIRMSNGDAVIKLEPEFAKEVNAFFAKELKVDKCSASKQKRGLDFQCLAKVSEDTFHAAAGDGPLNDLIQLHGGPPIPRAVSLLRAMEYFVSLGAKLSYQLNDASERYPSISRLIFWLVVLASEGQQITNQNLIPADRIRQNCYEGTQECTMKSCMGVDGLCTVGPAAGCPCDRKCLPPDLTPSCMNCGGELTKKICKGLPEHGGLWAGCPCIPFERERPGVITESWEEIRKRMTELPLRSKDPPQRIICDDKKAKVVFPYDFFVQLTQAFCKDFALMTAKEKTISSSDLGTDPNAKKDTSLDKLNLNWTLPSWKTEGCSESCTTIFGAFITSLQCFPDAPNLLPLQMMANEGAYNHDCGIAQYKIEKAPEPEKPPQPKAPFNEGKCRLKVQRWVNTYTATTRILHIRPYFGHNSTYSVQVDIYDDHGILIGHHDRAGAGAGSNGDKHEKAGPLPVASKLEGYLVVTPIKREQSYVQFAIGDQSFPSNNDKGDPRAHCNEGPDILSADNKELFKYIDCTFECKWGGGKSSDGSG